MLVCAARTPDPKPHAPVVTARAAVGLHFGQVRSRVHSPLPFTDDLHEFATPTPFRRCARKDELDKDVSRNSPSSQS